RRYMMNYYYSRGSFTISELIEVSEFSRPTVTNTVLEAMNMGYLEELPDKIDRRRRDFRPTAPMLEAWQNYCNALLANEKFLQSMKLAQTVMVMRELEADKTPQDM
ncbi:MarR family winged helix-turn-helix transcriptional regulator, partial [Alphaproteobacteria bacterium]|nr:MarR family winged helix-turn-helix transcriptional regulator [Alphaproteobacteria bacterium]